MNQPNTVPPKNKPRTIGEVIARGFRLIADGLDEARDLARNGPRQIIERIGLLEARIDERFDTIDESNASMHKTLRAILLQGEQLRTDVEAFQRTAADDIAKLKKDRSNGHTATQ